MLSHLTECILARSTERILIGTCTSPHDVAHRRHEVFQDVRPDDGLTGHDSQIFPGLISPRSRGWWSKAFRLPLLRVASVTGNTCNTCSGKLVLHVGTTSECSSDVEPRVRTGYPIRRSSPTYAISSPSLAGFCSGSAALRRPLRHNRDTARRCSTVPLVTAIVTAPPSPRHEDPVSASPLADPPSLSLSSSGRSTGYGKGIRRANIPHTIIQSRLSRD